MDYIDLSSIPLYTEGRYKGKKNWRDAIGQIVSGEYHGEKYSLRITGYTPKGQVLSFIVNGQEKKILTSGLIKNQMGSILGHITKDFRYEIGDIVQSVNQDLVIVDRKTEKRIHGKSVVNEKLYKYVCKRCGFDSRKPCYEKGKYKDYWVCECLLMRGVGCPCCGHINRIVQTGINDIHTTNPWMEKYLADINDAYIYSACSEVKVSVKCPNCDGMDGQKRRIADIYHRQRISCNKCNDGFSMPNKFMYSLLLQFKNEFQEFETEFSPKWAKVLIQNKKRKVRYDFMFIKNGEKIIVEMDGAFHYKENKISKDSLEFRKEVDEKKNLLASNYGYRIIRIDSMLSNYQYIINNILKSELVTYLDINKINWNECIEYSQKSIVKDVCDIKKRNPDMSTSDIAKLFGISYDTIRTYLKTGTRVGWCQYDVKKEIRNHNIRSKDVMRKCRYVNDIIVIKEDIIDRKIEKYNSIKSAALHNGIVYETLLRNLKNKGVFL